MSESNPNLSLPEELSGGLLNPAEAFRKVKVFLEDGGNEKVELIYTSLRSLVWNFVASRDSGSQIDQWADAILRLRQLLRTRGVSVAERFTVLSDMLQQSARFSAYHAKGELKTKKHVLEILKALLARDGTAERSAIASETKLRDANLSRVLANLAAAGWISRTPNGREVTVSLTTEGFTQAKESFPSTPEKKSTKEILADEFSSDILHELWPTRMCALAISDDAAGVFKYGEGFLAMFGTSDRGATLTIDSLRKNATMAGDKSTFEVPTGDGRYVQIVERRGNGRSLWLAWDITSYRAEIEEFRRRERLLNSEIAELRRAAGKQLSRQPTFISVGDASSIRNMLITFRNDLLTPAALIESTARAISAGVMGPMIQNHRDYLTSIVSESSKLHGLLKNIINTGEVWDSAIQDDFMPAELVTNVVDHLPTYGVKVHAHTAGIGNVSVRTNQQALRSAIFQAISGMVELTPFGEEINVSMKASEGGIEVAVCSGVVDTDISLFGRTRTQSLAMCNSTVQHFGGKFSFGGSASEGCIATILWPAESKGFRP
jgi:DNA-binding MarR family transcriptional regulator